MRYLMEGSVYLTSLRKLIHVNRNLEPGNCSEFHDRLDTHRAILFREALNETAAQPKPRLNPKVLETRSSLAGLP